MSRVRFLIYALVAACALLAFTITATRPAPQPKDPMQTYCQQYYGGDTNRPFVSANGPLC